MEWENKLKQEGVCSVKELKKYVKLTPREEKIIEEVANIHPMRISKYYISLINKNDRRDPIRKLIIPSAGELDLCGSYDTSGEKENTKTVGLQHKYKQTVLILSTNRCAAYCRFCFRKRLVGLATEEILSRFAEAIKYIKNHKEVNNVLISGGDPLILPTEILKEFLVRLSLVKHLDFIRIGSRIPVVFPERIVEDKTLLDLFKKFSLKKRRIYLVTHFNHPREITKESIKAIDKLIQSNVIINNQTVLLKGVNDNQDVLAELLNKLVSIGVNPYYIFQCRPVKRVRNNFQVSFIDGYKIIEKAKEKLNGCSKRFRYVMSHRTGKIEIVGILGKEIYLKYHQAKDKKNFGRFFKRRLNKKAAWLDDL